IRLDLGACRRSDLHERDVSSQRWEILEQALIGPEAKLQALAVVEPVDADDQLAVPQADLETLDLRTIEILDAERAALPDLDTDRKRPDSERAAECADPPVVEDLAADLLVRIAFAQRLRIRLGLHSDDVVRRDRLEQLLEARQRLQDVEARKRHVQKEAQRAIDALVAQRLAEREELGIVHPDQIVG